MTSTTEAAPLPAPSTTAPGQARRHPVGVAVLVSAVGLLVQAGGYAMGWHDQESRGLVLWYVGFALIVCPYAALLLVRVQTDHQRLGGSLGLGLMLYASWLLSDPVLATRYDESLHVTTLVDLTSGDGFFAQNSLLPVSPHYPGLELATAGIHWLSGLPLIACQILVVLIARVVLLVSLFLLASRIGRSTLVGSIAVLLYCASAQFYFFNAQFSYQTVAIAMLMAAMCLLVRAFDAPQERPWGPLLAAQVCLAGLAVTHHLTSWLVVGALWVLTGLFALGDDRRRTRLVLVTAELATLVVAAWTAVIAPLLVAYLGPIFSAAGDQLRGILDADGGGRTIGSDAAGVATPRWETGVMALSILIWVLLLMPSCWAAWRRSSIGRGPARYLPLVAASTYPFLQLTRFSPTAGEIGDRASTFVTMAMALVVAVWVAPHVHKIGRLVVPVVLVLILGGTTLGSGPDWQRMTGPWLPGAEQRSVDAETVAVSQWAGKYLPTGSRIAADAALSRMLPNFAPVVPVTQPGGLANITPLFISTSVDDEDLALIQDNKIDFVMVDTRLIGQTVRSGEFFEGSAGYGPTASTLDAQQLDKFRGSPGFTLVMDDGTVQIYDVRSLRGAPSTYVGRPAPGIPGTWSPGQLLVLLLTGAVALALRGRLLDPRRFSSRHLWRIAVLLPCAMVVGGVGVAAGMRPWAGSFVLVLLLAAGITTSRRRPVPALAKVTPGTRYAAVAITTVVLVASLLAGTSAWHGLFDHPALAAPSNDRSAGS